MTTLNQPPGQLQNVNSCSESPLQFATYKMLGIQAQAITTRDLITLVGKAVERQAKYVIANHNLHSLYLWHHDPKMRDLYARATYTHVDGMALILLFRLMGGRLNREHRTTYLDLLPPLAEVATREGWKIYYLGSKPDLAEKGAARLREQYPGMQIRTHHGYFDSRGEDNKAVLEDIRSYAPHILMVGMGMPRQETWINENLSQLSARTIFCVGCLMDYVAGEVATCPRWLAGIGFEWFYRLLSEPARLWHRYLVEPWFILVQLGNEYFKIVRSLEASPSVLEDGSK